MPSSMTLLSVIADVAILLGLAAVLASPRLSPLARLLIATLAFACAWLSTAAFAAMEVPGWTLVLGGAVIGLSILVIAATVHVWARDADDGDSKPGHRGAGGGGGPGRRRPDAPQPGGGDSAPTWWPEFERQLASYVAEREKENPEPAVLPGRAM